jgi:hypothetical protein
MSTNSGAKFAESGIFFAFLLPSGMKYVPPKKWGAQIVTADREIPTNPLALYCGLSYNDKC